MPKKAIHTVLDTVGDTISKVERKMETVIKPVRKNVLRRFPHLFILLVTFGAATTFFAFERILVQIDFINDRPFLMLAIGVVTLALTGTLYKKLG